MGEESSEGHGSFLMDSQGNGQDAHLILFSLKRIALPRAEISRLRARPKGFPIALWKPSGLSS